MNVMLSYWYRLYTKQTACEQKLEPFIAKMGHRYRTQHIVMSCKAILDYYFPDYNLALEIDDPGHDKPGKKKKDAERTKLLEAKGIKVLRCTNYEVKVEPDLVIEMVQEEIDRINRRVSSVVSKPPTPLLVPARTRRQYKFGVNQKV